MSAIGLDSLRSQDYVRYVPPSSITQGGDLVDVDTEFGHEAKLGIEVRLLSTVDTNHSIGTGSGLCGQILTYRSVLHNPFPVLSHPVQTNSTFAPRRNQKLRLDSTD